MPHKRKQDQEDANNKHLKKDYGCLKSSYDKLMSAYDSFFKRKDKLMSDCDALFKENDKLKNQVEDVPLQKKKKEVVADTLRLRQGIPYLMLPVRDDGTNDDVRDLYSLVEGESIVASLVVPTLTKTTMCFESLGWLLTVQADGSMSLVDPFSNTVILVPHKNTFPDYNEYTSIDKMVLSSRPNETSDFILMVISGEDLAFWRLGDKAWNKIKVLSTTFINVVHDGGERFYAITDQGIIWVINLAAGTGNDNPKVAWRTTRTINCQPVPRTTDWSHQYILKSIDGSLLAISRNREDFYATSKFEVYKIDTNMGKCKEIDSLGSMAVFLGHNSSIAVDASKFPGVIKANHIYFTDFGYFEQVNVVGGDWIAYCDHSSSIKSVDTGVYNMETLKTEAIYPLDPFRSHVCPAMWITPN